MEGLLVIVVGSLLGVALAHGHAAWRIHQLRKQGVYPQPGQASEADVMRLLKAGHKAAAIRCHRELHPSSLKAAKEAVERLAV